MKLDDELDFRDYHHNFLQSLTSIKKMILSERVEGYK